MIPLHASHGGPEPAAFVAWAVFSVLVTGCAFLAAYTAYHWIRGDAA